MKFFVTIEQRRIGFIEAEVPDEWWEQHTYPYSRRKAIKQAATKALEEGAVIDWQPPTPPEATTDAWPVDMFDLDKYTYPTSSVLIVER